MTKFPFYSRKYGIFFKNHETFKRFDEAAKRKWLVEKHGGHNGKAYLPNKFRSSQYRLRKYGGEFNI